nr:uncharacterized protein LOC109183092 [Ipomoea batatas]
MFVVAQGTAYPTTAETTVVHNQPVLPNHVKVMVDEVVIGAEDCLLPVPVLQYTTLNDVVGTYTQWPIHLVLLDEANVKIISPRQNKLIKDPSVDLSAAGTRRLGPIGLVEGDAGEVNVGDDGEEEEGDEVEIELGEVEGVVEPAAEVVADAGVRLAEEVEDLGCDSRGNDAGAGEFQSGLGADDQIEAVAVAGEGEVDVNVAAANKAVMEEEAEAGGWRWRWWGNDLLVDGDVFLSQSN